MAAVHKCIRHIAPSGGEDQQGGKVVDRREVRRVEVEEDEVGRIAPGLVARVEARLPATAAASEG